MTTPAWISLGSNLGDRRAILDDAVRLLSQTPGVAVTAVSSFHETLPVGGPAGQGRFLNAAARLETTLSPRELLAATQSIEADLGRVRTVRWGERTLDVDVLMYGRKFLDEPDLKLPHPRLAVRRFVLEPLVEIEPRLVDTITRRTSVDLLANLDRRPRLLMLDDSILSLLGNKRTTLAAAISGILITAAPTPRRLSAATRVERRLDHQDHLHRLDSIRSAIRRLGGSNSGWIVASFVLDISYLEESSESSPAEPSQSDDGWQAERKIWHREVSERIVGLPDPMLIVATSDSSWRRKPGISPTPIYWPEATEPDAIIAEVSAVCRGIARV